MEDVPDDGDCAFEAVRRALWLVDRVSSRRELQLAAAVRFRDRARAVGDGGVALTDYLTMRDYVGSRVQRGLDVDPDLERRCTFLQVQDVATLETFAGAMARGRDPFLLLYFILFFWIPSSYFPTSKSA